MATYDVSDMPKGWWMVNPYNTEPLDPQEREVFLSGRNTATTATDSTLLYSFEWGSVTFNGQFSFSADGRVDLGSTLTGLVSEEAGYGQEVIQNFSMTMGRFIELMDQSFTAFLEEAFSGNDTVTGTAQDDRLGGFGGNDTVDGGEGTDTLIVSDTRSALGVTRNDDGTVTLTSAEGTDLLVGIERIQATDGTLALDVDGVAGQAYRLYSAALNREPDPQGLTFWVNQMDSGNTLKYVAASFLGSEEFLANYGDLTDEAFVEQLYVNILGRPAEEGGKNYWVEQLQTHGRDDILMNISESPENKTVTAAATADGIWLM